MFSKAIVFLVLQFFLSFSSLLADDPFSLYLTWIKSPEKTMTIQWVSKESDSHNKLKFKCLDELKWQEVVAVSTPMPYSLPYVIHRVELNDLKPDSNYQFKLASSDRIYKFRTMPKDLSKPVRFVVGGDMYNGTKEMLEKTNKQAAAANPYFVVIGGDIAYSATSRSTKENAQNWLDWLDAWQKTMVTDDGFLIPILPAIGNHEVCGGKGKTPKEAPFFYALFPMPGLQGYNYLDFGNYLSFIFLDSGHTHPISGEQTKWLEKVLIDKTDFTHKFAVYHIPAYPSKGRYHSTQSKSIRQHWVPLFEKYGTQVVFENNDHTYKRSHPLLAGKIHPEGVLYLGDGAWSVGNVRTPKTPKQAWYLAKTESTLNFIIVTIDKSERRFQAFTPSGVLIDEVSSDHDG